MKVDNKVARVLVVEDEPDSAAVLGKLLEMRGYAVDVVTDSTQCLSHLESFNPDVVLLDIAMPKISGYDLAQQIRTRPDSENVAIIAMSGYADREHKARSLQSGCDRHLVKPIDFATLETTILDELRIGRHVIDAHERNAVSKRLSEIEVALGHPRLTSGQAAALMRERTSLEGVSAGIAAPENRRR